MSDTQPRPWPPVAYAVNLPRFYAFQFLTMLQLWLPVWVLYLRDLRGLSLAQIAAMEALFWLVVVAAELPTGALADRWGRKLSLLLGAAGNALAVLIFGIATGYPLLLLSYLVWGISTTLTSGANTAFVYDTLAVLGREREFTKVWGRAQAWTMAAGLLASLTGAPLAAATDLAVPIQVSVPLSLAAVAIGLSFREPPRLGPVLRPTYGEVLRLAVRHALRHPPTRAMIAVAAVYGAATSATYLFTQPYLAGAGVPLALLGLVLALVRLALLVGSLTAHRLAVWLGERNAFSLVCGLYSLTLLLLGVVDSAWSVTLLLVLGLSGAARLPLVSDHIARHAPPELRATVASAASLVVGLGTALTQYPLGLLADRASVRAVFLAMGIGTATLGGAALAGWAVAVRRAEATPGPKEPLTFRIP